MLPEPEDGLQVLAATIRAARRARGLTQQRVATEAKVSRAHLALIERGGNVTVRFLLKLAHYLGLSNIALDSGVQFTSGKAEAINVGELLASVDMLAVVLDHIRGLTIEIALPPSERARLKDAPALRDFVARHAESAEGLARLSEAIEQLSRGAQPSRSPKVVAESPRTGTQPVSRRRSRKGED